MIDTTFFEGRLTAEMKVYAKLQAIKFAKWLNQEGWTEYDEADRWICKDGYNSRNVLTTKQLYEKFEKSLNA